MIKDGIGAYLHPLTPMPTHMKPGGRLRLPVSCLLCDLYGTLFISGSGDIGTALDQSRQTALIDGLLARYAQTTTAQDLLKQMHQEIKNQHARARARGIEHPEVTIESIWQHLLPIKDPERIRSFAIEFEMITNPVWPMPGMEALLAHCHHKGVRMGIVSNAQFYTPMLFPLFLGQEPADLGFQPELIFYSFNHGCAKPSPRLFEMARRRLELMGIASSAAAYMGNDMRNDIVPAHTAGFQTILFAGDARSLRLRKDDPKCSAIAPDMVVTRLDQLASYLH